MRIAVISDNPITYDSELCKAVWFSSETVVSPADWADFDAAFLIEPFSDTALKSWTGHPHLRWLKSAGELDFEIAYILTNIECEKKYLVAIPDLKSLEKYMPFCAEIEQIYLECDNGSHRIRKRISDGNASYFETRKLKISPSKVNEYEHRITENTYNRLALKADPTRHPIRKRRYCFMYRRQYFELDIFDFWKDKATLELELTSEDIPVFLPPEITVIKDVTEKKKYKNHYLASIPYEDYQTKLL